ncbi:hypothetical protein ACI3QN_13925, partial [Propionibacterium freudenreichii]|uniref:hypothetical protein n=1 Tax=Propionibacterium freudenreichii TaxID=1744 RepID=UPI003852A784
KKNTGKFIYSTVLDVELQSDEIAVDEQLTENYINPFYNFKTKTFYEGATETTVEALNKEMLQQKKQEAFEKLKETD